MSRQFWLPVLGSVALCACDTHPPVADGTFVFDDEVALVRNEQKRIDEASRELTVNDDAILVAIVDENLTDVTLRLSIPGQPEALEVENNLEGAGVEIAMLEVEQGSRLTVTLSGPPNAEQPGSVRLRVQQFSRDSADDPDFKAKLAGLRAWTTATNASFRVDSIRKIAMDQWDLAIDRLSAHGDLALAAQARLTKANAWHFFGIDWRRALEEAQRAERAFASLPKPDVINQARARYIQGLALREIGLDRAAVNPTSDEANAAARAILTELSAVSSPLARVERARALEAMAYIDMNLQLLDDAKSGLEQAQALFKEAGNIAGEREMRGSLATVLVERGRFTEAAKLLDAIFPEIDLVPNHNRRLTMLIHAARAQGFAGRTDEAIENLDRAISQARELELRTQEGRALRELGGVYWHRGDSLQAATLATESYNILRKEQNAMDLVYGLEAVGFASRIEGNYERALEYHDEAVRHASHPVARLRQMRWVGLDYQDLGKYPEAIASFRAALAVKLQDPRHQAFSDVKRELAQLLIEHGDGSAAILSEADALLADSLRQCLDVKDGLGEIGVYRVRASLLAKQGKDAAALAEYQRTFRLIFNLHARTDNAEFRALTHRHEQPAFRGYFDLVMKDLVAQGPAKPRPASAAESDALRMLELARESHFGAVGQPVMDADTTARVDALLEKMADRSIRIATLLKGETTAEKPAQLEALQIEMSKLRVEIDRERTAAARKSDDRARAAGRAVRSWRPVASNAVQLSYALGNEHAYVWARTSDGTRVAMLSESPAQIEEQLAELAAFDPQRAPAQIEQSLAEVSAVLLPAGLLPANSNVADIVAEGRIASVPFAGLRSPTDPARRLAETHSITMIPSLFTPEQPQSPQHLRPFRLVALASGSGTIRAAPVADPAPRLQAATAEIRAVAGLFMEQDPAARIKLFGGKDGDVATLRAIWSSGADVVHFATHALPDLRQPLASLLVLPATDAAGQATYLTAGQVQGWRGDTDLVFLSACESAIGPPRFASGMPGLQRAFLRAGARGVIATIWPIEDVMAREFAADFYQRFTRGQPAVEALRETQRGWLVPKTGASDAEQMRRRITALAHAYFTS
ncbi:MAG TPA: CHAT domain-containing tetratricopeptide repeat protein [Steroidobacteraceae bacterium]|nr:CHAT domain-containing tetratricopeptide repeat protein [Steroidobacteraceae bacterium]